jgi:hypothetical protein
MPGSGMKWGRRGRAGRVPTIATPLGVLFSTGSVVEVWGESVPSKSNGFVHR